MDVLQYLELVCVLISFQNRYLQKFDFSPILNTFEALWEAGPEVTSQWGQGCLTPPALW